MADNEAGGSRVAATTEPKDDRPQKVFPKKSDRENQDIMWIVEEFIVGTRRLQDTRDVVITAVGSDQVTPRQAAKITTVALEEAREAAEVESEAVALNIGTRAHSTSGEGQK